MKAPPRIRIGNGRNIGVDRISRPSAQSRTVVAQSRCKKEQGVDKVRPSSCLLPAKTLAISKRGSATLPPLDQIDRGVLETNPRRTQALWKRVMVDLGARRDTKASQARRAAEGGGKGNTEHALRSVPSSASTRTIIAKPADSDFRVSVLERKGISFKLNPPSQTAFTHFATPSPPTNRVLHCEKLNVDTSVWVNVNEQGAEGIMREYLYMTHYRLCEAEFAAYAKESFLRRDIRSLEPNLNRPWMTERMIELVAKPDEGMMWAMPPAVNQHIANKRYEFDIRPDCSYWLSVQAFNPKYKSQVQEWIYAMYDRITCPYFTIEFKRDDSTLAAAINQLAAASLLALYNRYLLKQKRIEATGKEWNDMKLNKLRHYGLTFTGDKYAFWCMTVIKSADWTWKGCEMKRVYQSNCSHLAGVENIVNWINEIHRWGLTVHGRACESDVKHCIQQTSGGFRTSLSQDKNSLLDSDNDSEDGLRQ